MCRTHMLDYQSKIHCRVRSFLDNENYYPYTRWEKKTYPFEWESTMIINDKFTLDNIRLWNYIWIISDYI